MAGLVWPKGVKILPMDIAFFLRSSVHLIIGETISKYKRLALDPAMNEIWATVFGKDFGNRARGDNKSNTLGTDPILVMDPEDVQHIPKIK